LKIIVIGGVAAGTSAAAKAGAINIPQENIREQIKALNKDKEIVVYCNKGVTGNAVQNIILGNGFKDVLNLSGGFKNYKNYIIGIYEN